MFVALFVASYPGPLFTSRKHNFFHTVFTRLHMNCFVYIYTHIYICNNYHSRHCESSWNPLSIVQLNTIAANDLATQKVKSSAVINLSKLIRNILPQSPVLFVVWLTRSNWLTKIIKINIADSSLFEKQASYGNLNSTSSIVQYMCSVVKSRLTWWYVYLWNPVTEAITGRLESAE